MVPLAGGGPLGLALGGGGGGVCSGAPPGCELGVAGGGVWSFDGGVFGLADSLDGVVAGALPLSPLLELCEHAPTDSASAVTHSNKLRFIRITSVR